MTSTSIGSGPSRGGNENHDNDPRSKTLGEHAPPLEPPAGAQDSDDKDAPPDRDTPAAAGESPPRR